MKGALPILSIFLAGCTSINHTKTQKTVDYKTSIDSITNSYHFNNNRNTFTKTLMGKEYEVNILYSKDKSFISYIVNLDGKRAFMLSDLDANFTLDTYASKRNGTEAIITNLSTAPQFRLKSGTEKTAMQNCEWDMALLSILVHVPEDKMVPIWGRASMMEYSEIQKERIEELPEYMQDVMKKSSKF